MAHAVAYHPRAGILTKRCKSYSNRPMTRSEIGLLVFAECPANLRLALVPSRQFAEAPRIDQNLEPVEKDNKMKIIYRKATLELPAKQAIFREGRILL